MFQKLLLLYYVTILYEDILNILIKIQMFLITILFCTVTLGCLILQQRYQRRHITMSYEHLRNNTENTTTENNERSIVDVEDLVSPLINAPM